MVGQTRHRIHLDEPRFTIVVAQKVHPPPTSDTHGVIGLHGQGPQLRLATGVQAAGTVILRFVRGILGCVIVKTTRRLDANQRQDFAPQYRRGVLWPHHATLDQDHAVQFTCTVQSGRQIGNGGHFAHTQTGTLMRRLDHQRQTQAIDQDLRIGLTLHHGKSRRRESGTAPNALGTHLIHPQRRTQHTAAGVRHTNEI